MSDTRTAPDPRLPWALLSILVAALFANQYLTLPKLRDFVIAQTDTTTLDSMQTRVTSLLVENVLHILNGTDFLVFGIIAATVGALVVAEWRARSLTLLIEEMRVSNRALYAFLFVVGLIATRAYLNSGHAFMGDTEAHTLRSFMVEENLRKGQLPAWSNYWYGGYPLTGYYGPFYFIATALLSIPLGGIQPATKLLLWSTHMASIFVMFWYLQEATGKRLGAIVGAVAYGLTFHRLHILLYRGDLQLAVVFLVYPLLLWVIERYLNEARHAKRTFFLFGFGLFVLVTTHHGYAFFGMVFLSVYIVLRSWLTDVRLARRIRQMTLLALSGIFGLLASTFSLLPFMTQTEYVRGLGSAPFVILIPNYRAVAALVQMVRWSPIAGDRNIGYVGVSILVLAALALPYVVRRRFAVGIALAACALCSLSMMRNFVDYNVKNTNFFLIFLCALTAYLPSALEDAASRWSWLRRLTRSRQNLVAPTLTLAALSFMALDLGPLTFHDVYRDADEVEESIYAKLIADGDDHKAIQRRLLKHVPGGDQRALFEPGDIGVVNAHTGIQTPLGRFHEGAGLSFGFNVEMVKNVNRDLHDARISDESLKGLYLMGVKYIIFRDRFRFFSPELEPSSEYRTEDEILFVRHASPLVASERVIPVTDVEGFDPDNIIDRREYYDEQTYGYDVEPYRRLVAPLLNAMELDREHGRAGALLIRGAAPPAPAPNGQELEVHVEELAVDIDTIRIAYRSNGNGFARLAYAYFPDLDVRLDGEPTEFWPSGMHQILIPIETGDHLISIRGRASPVRVQSFWFSVAVLIAGALLPSRALRPFELT